MSDTREIAEKIVRENAMTNREEARLIDAVAEALRNERERCAKIADSYSTFGNGYKRIRKEIAAAIRNDKGEV